MLVPLSALALVYRATPAPAAQVGRWHALATTSAGFITDGESYAAWNPTASSPMVLYAASTGQTREFPGCFAGGSASEYEPDQGAAGMLLIGCAGHPYLLSAKTGSLRPLPRPAGTLWRRLGSHYVEGATYTGSNEPVELESPIRPRYSRGRKRRRIAIDSVDAAWMAVWSAVHHHTPLTHRPSRTSAAPSCRQ